MRPTPYTRKQYIWKDFVFKSALCNFFLGGVCLGILLISFGIIISAKPFIATGIGVYTVCIFAMILASFKEDKRR